MLQFKLIRKTLLTTVSASILVGSLHASEPIGSISEHKGQAYLTRDLDTESIEVGTTIPPVLQNDTAETKNGRMVITFLDDSASDLTENAKAYLDKVYYDPDPSKSEMTMRFVQGTARFTSGLNLLDYFKRSSVVSCTEKSIKKIGLDAINIANEEGLQAHALSIECRIKK